MIFNGKIFRAVHHSVEARVTKSKNFGIIRVNYLMINRKGSCENEVKSLNLAA